MQTTNKTFSRADYMSKKCSHHEYYSQFVNSTMKNFILDKYPKKKLSQLFSEDEHLNNIPISWWDNLANYFRREVAATNKIINGQNTWSLSDGVCALKAAAREIIK